MELKVARPGYARDRRRDTAPRPTTPTHIRASVVGSGTAAAISHVEPLPYSEETGGVEDGSARM
jgi:hypothetical protein